MAEPVMVTIRAEQRPGRREKKESMESRAEGGPDCSGLEAIMGPMGEAINHQPPH
jgi:hypothetical protein